MKTYRSQNNVTCHKTLITGSDSNYVTNTPLRNGNTSQHLNRRSNTMETTTRFKTVMRTVILVLTAILITSFMAYSQDIVFDSAATFHGRGTYNVKGNIDNSLSLHAVDTLHGRINLVGTTPETLGVIAKGALVFDTLHVASNSDKVAHVTITTDSALAISDGALVVNGQTLNVNGAATKTGGALTANGVSDIVNYNGALSQTIIGTAYNQLNLTNSGGKNLENVATALTLNHSGGALTVDQNLSVTNTATIGTLANVAPAKTLALGTKATITQVDGNAGTIAAGDTAVIGVLAANTGAINGGAGLLSFTGTATNNGKIVGSTGVVAFEGVLTHNADTVAAGTGGVVFNAVPVIGAAGTVASGSGLLGFKTDVQNNGTIELSSSGSAQFDGNFTSIGTLNFGSASTVTYAAVSGTQAVAPTAYGNLILTNTDKAAADSFEVKGNLTLDKNMTMPSGKPLVLTSAANRNVNGTGEVIGSVKRTGTFTVDSLYTFNSAVVAMALDQTVAGGTVQLTMLPDSNVTSPSFTRYAKRYYAFSGNNLGVAQLKGMSLAYANNELVNGVNPLKLGVRDYNGVKWNKVTNIGYVRSVDTARHAVTIAGVSASLASVTEFGLVNVAFGTVQTGSWNIASTWDEGVPSNLDDAEINPLHHITVDSDTSVASVALLDSTATLTINDGSLAVGTELTNLGTITVGGGTLNKSLNITSNLVNNKKVIVTPLGHLTMTGKLKNYGDITNDGVIDVGQ
jgi:hypothetical protein